MNFVKYEQRGAVAIVTIDRQSALNALNSEVLTELEQVFDAIPLDEARCVILTGAGEKAFVAGADIGEMCGLSKATGETFGKKGNAVFRKIEMFPLPVIAAVNGFALGGGCELALACDIRLAAENAVFGQPEVSLGITPGFGGSQRLPRLVGPGKAKELLYTKRNVKAAEALAIGLANSVCPTEQLLDNAIKMAEAIAANAPIAVRGTKKAVNDGMQVDIDAALDIEAAIFGDCFETEDQRVAMAAFLEKRKPDPFVNR